MIFSKYSRPFLFMNALTSPLPAGSTTSRKPMRKPWPISDSSAATTNTQGALGRKILIASRRSRAASGMQRSRSSTNTNPRRAFPPNSLAQDALELLHRSDALARALVLALLDELAEIHVGVEPEHAANGRHHGRDARHSDDHALDNSDRSFGRIHGGRTFADATIKARVEPCDELGISRLGVGHRLFVAQDER